jgi:hypothetical protein
MKKSGVTKKPKGAAGKGKRSTATKSKGPPLRRQPADREGRRRRPRAGLHRGHANWKRDLGKRLDALIVRVVPHVRKAVKWNSPFYSVEGHSCHSTSSPGTSK